MAGRRKLFDCGHRGYGAYCHACRQQRERQEQKEPPGLGRQREWDIFSPIWDEWFPGQAGASHKFPLAVVKRATNLAERLLSAHYSTLRGDKMQGDPRRVRFELPGRYRMVGRLEPGDRVVDIEVLTHAEYNTRYFSE